nr:MAG TPA: hypothetical protein [Caudoviricetes sp.]
MTNSRQQEMYSPTDFLGTQPSETAEQPKVKLNKWLTLEIGLALRW